MESINSYLSGEGWKNDWEQTVDDFSYIYETATDFVNEYTSSGQELGRKYDLPSDIEDYGNISYAVQGKMGGISSKMMDLVRLITPAAATATYTMWDGELAGEEAIAIYTIFAFSFMVETALSDGNPGEREQSYEESSGKPIA